MYHTGRYTQNYNPYLTYWVVIKKTLEPLQIAQIRSFSVSGFNTTDGLMKTILGVTGFLC